MKKTHKLTRLQFTDFDSKTVTRLIKKLTTQVLCGQCEVDPYPIRQTTVLVLSIFWHERFQSTKTPVFVRKHLSNGFAPYFLFSGKNVIKCLC